MKFLLLVFLLFCFYIPSLSQCYEETRNEGIKAFELKQFKRALAVFESAEYCPDRPSSCDLPLWIDKCHQRLINASNEDLFKKAQTVEDFKRLADKGYAKAYAPLAEKYFSLKNYSSADKYARKAFFAKVGTQQAKDIIDKLDLLGFYDNGENGGKPNL